MISLRKRLATEDPVEEHLAVVGLAVVDVEVEGAVAARSDGLDEPRLEESEVVVERVPVGRFGQEPSS